MGEEYMTFDVEKIRKDFDILSSQVHGKPLSYLDSAATTLKPKVVTDVVDHHYRLRASNVHRGVHWLSEQATLSFEQARQQMQLLIGARSPEEVIFTSGTTHAVNQLALSIGRTLNPGDEILVSEMEHHSNLVPWQIVAAYSGLKVVKIPLAESGDLDLEAYYKALNARTKVVAVTYVSNAIGTVNPVKEMIQAAHGYAKSRRASSKTSVTEVPVRMS